MRILLACCFFVSLARVSGQAPPNDDFANATIIAGSSISVTATFAGATYENGEPTQTFVDWQGGSVWFNWTAPESSFVVVTLRQFKTTRGRGALDFFTGTDLNALNSLGRCRAGDLQGRYGTFSAVAGSNYWIRVEGVSAQPFNLRLVSANSPVFIVQPADNVVSPLESVCFSALASAPPNALGKHTGTVYQWLFNGVPIDGEVFPSLLIHGVTTNHVGTYSVLASNALGTIQSTAAQLTVIDTNPVPRIEASQPGILNFLTFSLSGEPGRWYKIESSTNLQRWQSPSWLLLSNATLSLTLPTLGATHFTRVSLNGKTDVCVGQLKQMQWAQNLYAVENDLNGDKTFLFTDLYPYVPRPGGWIRNCPEGGTYIFGTPVTNNIYCSDIDRGHFLAFQP